MNRNKKILLFCLLDWQLASLAFSTENNSVVFDSAQPVFSTFSTDTVNFNLLSQQTQNECQVSGQKTWSEKKHPLAALTATAGFNILLSSYNRFVIRSGWATVGAEDFDKFWEKKPEWDPDWYWTNFFLHPYQGAQYYMASRGSNLGCASSFAVTFLGSLMWEYLCESTPPSINDQVYTSIGSFCVGEMFYRLSQEADSLNHLFALAVNPQRLWTEHVWQIKQKSTSGNINSLSLGFQLGNYTGITKTHGSGNLASSQTEIFPVLAGINFDTEYGDPYSHDSNKPFSQFTLSVSGEIGAGSGISGPCAYEELDKKLGYAIRIFSDGMMFARTVNFGGSRQASLGMTMIYDFNWHSSYMISSLAPGFAFKEKINFPSGDLKYQLQLAGILLGNTDFIYFHRNVKYTAGRTYSYTTGFQSILKSSYCWNSGHSINFAFRGYAMYDFEHQKQSGADTGWEYIGLLSASYEIPLSKTVRLGFQEELYGKAAVYKQLPFASKVFNNAKIYAKLQLK